MKSSDYWVAICAVTIFILFTPQSGFTDSSASDSAANGPKTDVIPKSVQVLIAKQDEPPKSASSNVKGATDVRLILTNPEEIIQHFKGQGLLYKKGVRQGYLNRVSIGGSLKKIDINEISIDRFVVREYEGHWIFWPRLEWDNLVMSSVNGDREFNEIKVQYQNGRIRII